MPSDPLKPLVLAVDSTNEYGSLALVRGGDVIEEVLLHSPSGFAHVLFDSARDLLGRNKLGVGDIGCFASASGPGSFTGVRVGLAFTKGLAAATNKPAVGVSNLRAPAALGSAPLRAAFIDARRGQVYGAVYDAYGETAGAEVVSEFGKWAATLPESGVELISADFTPFGLRLSEARLASVPVITAPRALAAAIGRIAAAAYARGEASDPSALDANYVRRSDAELFWKE